MWISESIYTIHIKNLIICIIAFLVITQIILVMSPIRIQAIVCYLII